MGQAWKQVIAFIASIVWASESVVQIFENYRLKSVEGYSVDYFLLALNGTLFYLIYSVTGYFFPSPDTGTVLIGDLVFPVSGLIMLLIELYQFHIYPRGNNRLSGKNIIFVIVIWTIILINLFLIEVFHVFQKKQYWNVLGLLGYGKLIVSFVKYAPAIYWNYVRKSTKGWPTLKIILDIVGGTLSFVSGTISLQNGYNIAKLGLAVLTIVYDLIFIFQACVLYRNPKKTALDIHLQKKLLNRDDQKQCLNR